MTKESFMKRLVFELKLHFNSEEIGEIINDYNEFFSLGLADGKNEQELCQYFGDPKDIVKNIKLESKKRKKGEFSLSFFTRIIAAMLILVYMVSFFNRVNTNNNIINESIVAIIFVGILLWFVLGEKILTKPINYNIKSVKYEKYNRKIILIHLVLIILMLKSLYPYLTGLLLSIVAFVYIHRFSYYQIKTKD